MTKEEKLEILQAAEVRAYGAVASTEGPDMGAEGFLTLLHAIEQLAWAQERLRHPVAPDFAPPIKSPDEPVETAEEAKPDQEAHAETATGGTAEPEPELPTKDQVRAQLARYQANANLDVPALMKSMGYSKLSEIPAAQYMDLLERAQEWVDGEG